MAQTALSSNGHTLYFNDYTITAPRINEQSDQPSVQSPAEEVSFLLHNGLFFFKEKAKASFQIAKPYQSFFALIKGLIEFYRGSAFAFVYDREARLVEVELDQSALPALQAFLHDIDALLQKEIAFKSALKQVLQFEEEYKAKKELAYHTFLNVR